MCEIYCSDSKYEKIILVLHGFKPCFDEYGKDMWNKAFELS